VAARASSVVFAALAIACFAAYAAAAAGEPQWLDASELAAAAWGLGVAHPPGHPLALLVGRAAALVPLGPIALRVSLASAATAALAAVQAARLATHVARRARGGAQAEGVDVALGVAAGILFAGSYAAAFQAVRPEVYALSSLCVLTCALALARFDERRRVRDLGLAGWAAGLALGNHPLLALAVVGPGMTVAAWVALARRPRAWRAVGWGVAATVLSLGILVYLPLRAARRPLVDWGAPTTAARLWWTLSAQAWNKAVSRGGVGDLAEVGAALTVELAAIGALLAIAGAYLMLRARAQRPLGLLLITALVADAAAPALVGFDVANPDAYGYLAAAVALGAALATVFPSVAIARLRPEARRRAGPIVAGALVAGALVAALVAAPRWSLAGERALRPTLTRWLDGAPPRALVVTSYFQTIFGLWALEALEGARPDLDVVHRHFLSYPGYRDDVVARRPELAPLLGARDVDAPALLSSGRPLLVEHDIDLPAPLVARAGVPVEPPGVEAARSREGARYFAWQLFVDAQRACRLPDVGARRRAIEAARARLGDAPELAELAARCLPR
jgi:hypothetical protein